MKSISHLLVSARPLLCGIALPALVLALTPALAFAQSSNTKTGENALASITTGDGNTANGYHAMAATTEGSSNTGIGRTALFRNTEGSYNTAVGRDAMRNNLSGVANTAHGAYSLGTNTDGNYNTAIGYLSLHESVTGFSNTALGYAALRASTSGDGNVALGFRALDNTTGGRNIGIGVYAGTNLTTGENNIAIGAAGVAGESNTIRIGKKDVQTRAFIQGIYGTPVNGGVQVVVNSAGKLGVLTPSSARFKEKIEPMNEASEAILALNPVTFRYKAELHTDDVPQFGLLAEEVEKVNPDLVARDETGKLSGVRYEAVNAMLLNEFLKEHRTVQAQSRKLDEQQAKIAELEAAVAQQKHLEATVARQQTQIDALTAGLEKVANEKKRALPEATFVVAR